jgi:two-component system chemotaxis response regulator CheY
VTGVQTCALPISALGKEDLVKRCIMTGAKNFIVKPIDRNTVLARIVSVLENEGA